MPADGTWERSGHSRSGQHIPRELYGGTSVELSGTRDRTQSLHPRATVHPSTAQTKQTLM